jgi:hypothetical protein
MTRPLKVLAALLCALAMFTTACGSGDDGAAVRELGSGGDSTSASAGSGSASGSSSGSSSGVSSSESAANTPGDGGYEYASNVDSHRLVVADICEIADALDAGDWDTVETLYRDGKNSVKGDDSIRSIGGFAARDDRSHGLTDFYGTPAPLDEFITSAIDGTGAFAGESDDVRAQGVEKGIQNQTMVAWTIHELNSALSKAADANFDIATGAVHNWDEGWAFFHGSEPGCAPYATGNKRAGNFGTTGNGDTAQANEAILAAMIEGRDALVAEDMAGAEAAAADVVRNVAITYSQATIRYAHLIAGDLADGDEAKARVHQAEGYAFWRVMEAVLVGAGADSDTISSILGLENEPGANGGSAEIREALAPAWETLGISTSDIGMLESEEN